MSDNTKPAAAPVADNGMTSFPIYEVTVERSNNEKVVAEVPEYEIPVLQALHGEFNVTKGEHAQQPVRQPAFRLERAAATGGG